MTKYVYLHVLQGNYGYGHGWEDLTESEDAREVYADLRTYRANAPEYRYRMIERRELRQEASR